MPIPVIFAGTPDFAVSSLKALIDDPEFDVQLVITQPDKPVGRKQKLTPSPVKVAAVEAGIPVEQPENMNSFQLIADSFQFLIVVAYGQILNQKILDAPKIAAVNLHPSLLPRWRGATPMQSSILANDSETGVTLQRIVKELDAGPILNAISTPLSRTETIETLHDQLADIGAKLLIDTLKKPLTETEQDESKVMHCKKLTRTMGDVDPREMTAEEIDRHVRALVPWPGVRCAVEGEEVKLIETSRIETPESVALPCKGSILYVTKIQPPGKTVMKGSDWMRGRMSA